MSKSIRASFEAIKSGLNETCSKKFDLEDIDLRDEDTVVYIVEEGSIKEDNLRRVAVVATFEPVENDMFVRSYSLESQHEISEMVRKEDFMFEGPSNQGLGWDGYPKHVELLAYLAALAPNTNFAVEYAERY